MDNECESGRRADFGGKWKVPCLRHATDVIGSEFGQTVQLCREHAQEVIDAGLVTEPFMDMAEWMRRMKEGDR